MPHFNFSSVAGLYLLQSSINGSEGTITLDHTTGLPPAPFILVIEPETVREELVLVTSVAGNNLAVTRGYSDTAGTSHDAGSQVRHAIASENLRKWETHTESSSGVHGVSGAVVGTTDAQTLTNKTLTTPTIGDFTNAQHDHADASGGGKLEAANTHENPDTDSSPTALHHTLGTGANQAAPGNHDHSGVYAPASHNHSAASISTGTLSIDRLPTGTSGSTVALGNHVHPIMQAARFTTAGTATWNKPSGARFVHVILVGGGGAGGGVVGGPSGQGEGAGGGSGAYCSMWFEAASLPSSVTVTVGAGGTAVTGGNGGNGGDSKFGDNIIAGGGKGGAVSTATTGDRYAIPGAGGTPTLGSGWGPFGHVALAGRPGHAGFVLSGRAVLQSYGGDSFLGAGGPTPGNAGAGGNGATWGGGGSGGFATTSSVAGGSGARGICIVETWF